MISPEKNAVAVRIQKNGLPGDSCENRRADRSLSYYIKLIQTGETVFSEDGIGTSGNFVFLR